MKSFDEATRSAVREALRRAGTFLNLSAHTNIRVAFLAAYASGMTPVPEADLRAITDYLKRVASAPITASSAELPPRVT